MITRCFGSGRGGHITAAYASEHNVHHALAYAPTEDPSSSDFDNTDHICVVHKTGARKQLSCRVSVGWVVRFGGAGFI